MPSTTFSSEFEALIRVAPLTVTGTSYTVQVGDNTRYVLMTNSAAITVTVPTFATASFPVGSRLAIVQQGTGAVTIAAASGVTINKNAKLTLVSDGQYATVHLVKTATNTWLLSGQMVPAA